MQTTKITKSLVFRLGSYIIVIVGLGLYISYAASEIQALTLSMAKLPHDQLNLKFIELIALGEGLVKAALFGSVMAALLYVGVWVPLIQKSLTEPLSLLARHMNELASGNTDVKIDVSELSVELGGIAQCPDGGNQGQR